MSATNRGSKRRKDDFYSTPGWLTRAILPHLRSVPVRASILDPCAGTGAILHVLQEEWPGVQLMGQELDPERARVAACIGIDIETRDSLALNPWKRANLIITNPPFSLCLEFVKRALFEVDQPGTVAMLLPLSFLASAKRAEFHNKHPSDLYISGKRPSFTADGKTDACDYAWFVWGPTRGGRWWRIETETP